MKYFYTDPLAAAWMAKHFEMRFAGGLCFGLIDSTNEHGEPMSALHQYEPKEYIHPDSLHLLEPQIGDMISHFRLRAWRIDSMDDRAYFHPNMPNESIGRFTLKADNPQIIQRNGIAFMWPEVEE